jgi:hypothetical protein
MISFETALEQLFLVLSLSSPNPQARDRNEGAFLLAKQFFKLLNMRIRQQLRDDSRRPACALVSG